MVSEIPFRRRPTGTLGSYARLFLVHLRVSLTVAAAYRFQFLLDGALALL